MFQIALGAIGLLEEARALKLGVLRLAWWITPWYVSGGRLFGSSEAECDGAKEIVFFNFHPRDSGESLQKSTFVSDKATPEICKFMQSREKW